MKGKIHSLESFGTVDGPGVRYVVFTQGCPLRCAYCHNPDTWSTKAGEEMEPSYIIEQYNRNIGFYKDGGITVTGGEPLLQLDFLLELFTLAKEQNIHTCIDSSGIVFNSTNTQWMEKLDRLMTLTDLVMLDIKHINNEKHISLTELPNKNVLAFAEYLYEKEIPTWIRHVVVPGITDDPADLEALGYFIGGFTNVKALDILPYHDLGVPKYQNLGIEYKLKDVKPMDKKLIPELKKHVLRGIKNKRIELGLIQA